MIDEIEKLKEQLRLEVKAKESALAAYNELYEEKRWLREKIQHLQDRLLQLPTLRDQFAMAALNGMVTREAWSGDEKIDAAKAAYAYADAMMKHREQQ